MTQTINSPITRGEASLHYAVFKMNPMATHADSFVEGAKWQKEQPDWISVDAQLPELCEYVLVYNTEGATLVARLFANGWYALFADGEKHMGELTATHWQPIPKPPVK